MSEPSCPICEQKMEAPVKVLNADDFLSGGVAGSDLWVWQCKVCRTGHGQTYEPRQAKPKGES